MLNCFIEFMSRVEDRHDNSRKVAISSHDLVWIFLDWDAFHKLSEVLMSYPKINMLYRSHIDDFRLIEERLRTPFK